MMWNYFGNMMGWGGGFGWVFMLVFWGLVIWGIVILARGGSGHGGCCGHGGQGHGEKTALDILKERYAKGEVSQEDFEKMKKNLE